MSSNNILHKTHRDNRFTTINLTAVEDPELTGLAKAVHLYAMSRPEGWQLKIKDIVSKFKENKDTIYRAMILLEERGYLTRETIRNDNRTIVQWIYHWYEEPQPVLENQDGIENQDCIEKLELGKARTGKTKNKENQDAYYIPDTLSTNDSIDQGNNDPTPETGCKWCNFNHLTAQKPYVIIKALHDSYKEQFNTCPSFLLAKSPFDLLKPLLDANKTKDEICNAWNWWLVNHDEFEGKNLNIGYFVKSYDSICLGMSKAAKPEAPKKPETIYYTDTPEYKYQVFIDTLVKKWKAEGATEEHRQLVFKAIAKWKEDYPEYAHVA
jgi:hypothetical protein